MAGREGQHVGRGDRPTTRWQRHLRPLALLASEQHVNALHLLPGEAPLNVEIQADQRERQSNRLRRGCGTLRGERVHDVLQYERLASSGHRIGV